MNSTGQSNSLAVENAPQVVSTPTGAIFEIDLCALCRSFQRQAPDDLERKRRVLESDRHRRL